MSTVSIHLSNYLSVCLSIYLFIYLYGIHHWNNLISYIKLAWLEFEPTTTEFRSDAQTDWAIRPRGLLQFYLLFSLRFHFEYCSRQSPRLFNRIFYRFFCSIGRLFSRFTVVALAVVCYIDIQSLKLSFIVYFIDKRWIFKQILSETCCGLLTSKHFAPYFCCFI